MKKIWVIFLFLIIISGFSIFFRQDILDFYKNLSLKLPDVEKKLDVFLKETSKLVSTPPPLRIEIESPKSNLTQVGIINLTNIQREKYGLLPLKESPQLDASAAIKTEDMFAKQYFTHNSPSGEGITDLAKSAGYDFIFIGENLALGNFKNDEVLVQAWMDSPGHRENILNPKYHEIGVSVIKASFEGKMTWLIVQHFGLSSSVCPEPNEQFKTMIETSQKQIEDSFLILEKLQTEIKNMKPKKGQEYCQKIDQYNTLLDQYNNLIEETKKLIEQYNSQVNLFNECLFSFE